ncbi:hypothetical protein L915_03361 [Phytophthora nicotianae]|uniref:Uncharacterized protein n=2 Tax=Phytophthora nicotianae TaxID=4792 RepID=W2PCK4_PHYN3|nr:hypothetical protein PPTG_24635 [Phytophthora nicotianae INRA-310]ETK93473.1 hypothetical protein L915_03361 [Phytophthora nicotianae]ETM98375.1 hypothetical protein PPTG_24635 [Phytophthora nicotianae INRA-310]
MESDWLPTASTLCFYSFSGVVFGDEFISVEVRKVDDDPFEKKCEYSVLTC